MEKIVSHDLRYSDGEILGRGPNSFVFKGWFGEEAIPVAVKRLRLDASKAAILKEREEAVLDLVHPNVVRLFGVHQDACFRYITLELCLGSLEQVFNKSVDITGLPDLRDGLVHLAEGMHYVHSKGLVYFDVKPSNVLISASEPMIFKWADFGLQLPTSGNRGNFLSGEGSTCWLAPEILASLNESQHVPKNKVVDTSGRDRATVQSDVFSLGMIYFSIIAGGVHMFGAKNLIAPNIVGGRRVNLKRLERDHFAYEAIDGMTKSKSADRISLSKAIEMLQ